MSRPLSELDVKASLVEGYLLGTEAPDEVLAAFQRLMAELNSPFAGMV